jgi:hypothetical protein
MSGWTASGLRAMVGDLRQLASVRPVVLDDGAERGVRALLFSTGGGLDFSILTDRSMDIGILSWQGIPMGWQSPMGFASPALIDLEGDGGAGFNRGFSGFLITCGLNHIRLAANGEPQHGRFPFTPGSLKAYGESWNEAVPTLFCEGEVTQARYGAEGLRLRRRIEAAIGGASIVIRDTVENVGASSTRQPMLYHFNLGYPAIMSGTTVELDGDLLIGPVTLPDAEHGLATARSWRAQGGQATCIVRSLSGLAVRFAFDADTLGHLQLWHDLRPNVGVLSVEPCTSERRTDGTLPEEAVLEPGETRSYRVAISFDGSAAGILPHIGN